MRALISIICLLIAVVRYAEADGAEPVVEVEFHLLAWAQADSNLWLADERGEQRLVASASRPSGPYTYRGRPLLKIYRKERNAEGEIIKIPTASVQISEPEESHFLLVLLPEEKPPKIGVKYRVAALRNVIDPERMGYLSIYNFTDQRIAGLLNQQSFDLRPSMHTWIPEEAASDNNLVLRLVKEGDGQWEPVYSTIWGSRGATQTIILIVSNSEEMSVRQLQIRQKKTGSRGD